MALEAERGSKGLSDSTRCYKRGLRGYQCGIGESCVVFLCFDRQNVNNRYSPLCVEFLLQQRDLKKSSLTKTYGIKSAVKPFEKLGKAKIWSTTLQ